jgi:hypothetical protein
MRKVEWIIITEDNMDEKIAQLKAGGAALAIFGLTAQGYENLGLNFSDIRALVQQQQQIIVAYDNYYKASVQALDAAETQRLQEEVTDTVTKSEGSKWNPFD